MPRTNAAFLTAAAVALCLSTGIGQQTTAHPLTQTGAPNASGASTKRANYVGDSACLPCHRDQALSYAHTAHHLTSQPGSRNAILGSFEDRSNVLMIADPSKAEDGPGLYFRMDAKRDGFYETAVTGWPGLLQERTEQMDVVIGSGVRGQSYLYWHGDQLFELPVSYWSDGRRWINSPGYKNGTTDFSRPVDPRCLECHATYIQPLSTDLSANSYDKQSLITGISCETCHGPGAEHVAMHQAKPVAGTSPAEAILNPARFTRDRQVDLCALCHNGIRQKEVEPAFSFIPGQPLDNYLRPISTDFDTQPNVHGDQVGLLKKSRCYLSSPNMSCSTCHNVHAPEQPAASYSAKCLSCHKVESCGMSKTTGHSIASNCIDCHMPVQSTTAIVSETAGQLIQPRMRTHWIKIYK
jgi:hypothetical protein